MPAPSRPKQPWPTDLKFDRAQRHLDICFDDGRRFLIPFELLRVESPSAEVQGHGGDQKQIVPGKKNVMVSSAEPNGNYAVRLIFDDGHDSGIFSWAYLYKLGRDQAEVWDIYLRALKERGLSRAG